jgi:hypothetical protein
LKSPIAYNEESQDNKDENEERWVQKFEMMKLKNKLSKT